MILRTPTSSVAVSINQIRRPLCDLLRQLPLLSVSEQGEPMYADAAPELLVGLAESADMVLQVVHDEFAAIGLLQSYTSPLIEGGEVKATHAAALGRLIVELGEVLSYAHNLSSECLRQVGDYIGKQSGADDDQQLIHE